MRKIISAGPRTLRGIGCLGAVVLAVTACASKSSSSALPTSLATPTGVTSSAGSTTPAASRLTATASTTASLSTTPSAPPTASSTPAASAAPSAVVTPELVQLRPVPGGPTLERTGITLRKVVGVPQFGVRLAVDPVDKTMYMLNAATGLSRVDRVKGKLTRVAGVADIVDGVLSGFAFGPDGTAYVVANKAKGTRTTHAIVRRGTPKGSGFTWTTLATTDEYPLGNDAFDHVYNGIVVSPDGKSVFVNAGSRTDHGEVEDNGGKFPGVRELPLTSAILRLPANSEGLVLHDSDAALKPYLFADGTRNAYSLTFAPNGQLFGTDNGPDADFPDELNLIQQGSHLGFPWRFGNQVNPQSLPGYDPASDARIEPGSGAAQANKYNNDPKFPKPPTKTFVDPLSNVGPAAGNYVDDDGAVHDVGKEGTKLSTFTPHISPLGLVFLDKGVDAASAPGDLHAVMLSWGASIGSLPDQGRDLDALTLTKSGSSYTVRTDEIASDFKNPIDEVMLDGNLYVLEYGQGGAIWELTFT
jgi:glucose/arabinose dehydrogenase